MHHVRVHRAALAALAAGVFAALGLPPAAAQTVYRCTGPAGQVLFSDEPCPAGSQAARVTLTPGNTVDNSALREAMREQRNAPAGAAEPGRVVTRSDAALPEGSDRSLSFECRQAQRDYEVTAGSAADRPALIEAKRSIMFATCGLREPDRVEAAPVVPVVPVITVPPIVVQRPVVRPRPLPGPDGRPPCPAYPGDLSVCGPRNAATERWRTP